MLHHRILIPVLALCAAAVDAAAQDVAPGSATRRPMARTSAASFAQPTFAAPVRLKGGSTPIEVESPGYAFPCWADVDGDGRNDLVVGQFKGGKMMVYRSLGAGRFAEGKWLEAGGKIAEVPGVW